MPSILTTKDTLDISHTCSNMSVRLCKTFTTCLHHVNSCWTATPKHHNQKLKIPFRLPSLNLFECVTCSSHAVSHFHFLTPANPSEGKKKRGDLKIAWESPCQHIQHVTHVWANYKARARSTSFQSQLCHFSVSLLAAAALSSTNEHCSFSLPRCRLLCLYSERRIALRHFAFCDFRNKPLSLISVLKRKVRKREK